MTLLTGDRYADNQIYSAGRFIGIWRCWTEYFRVAMLLSTGVGAGMAAAALAAGARGAASADFHLSAVLGLERDPVVSELGRFTLSRASQYPGCAAERDGHGLSQAVRRSHGLGARSVRDCGRPERTRRASDAPVTCRDPQAGPDRGGASGPNG